MSTCGRKFSCSLCKKTVIICSHCDRGHRYCSDICSQKSRQSSHRIANRKYQSTLKGRLLNAARQQRYRERQRKKVTEQSSPVSNPYVLLPTKPNKCISQRVNTVANTNALSSCHFCAVSCDTLLTTAQIHDAFIDRANTLLKSKHIET